MYIYEYDYPMEQIMWYFKLQKCDRFWNGNVEYDQFMSVNQFRIPIFNIPCILPTKFSWNTSD